MGAEEYQQKMEQNQRQILRELDIKERELANLKQTHSSCDVIIHCKTCRQELCAGEDLRKYEEHVVVNDSNFEHLVTVKSNGSSRDALLGFDATAHCKGKGGKGCDEVLAVRYKNQFYCLKAKAIGLEINNEWKNLNKWKNVPFEIQKM